MVSPKKSDIHASSDKITALAAEDISSQYSISAPSLSVRRNFSIPHLNAVAHFVSELRKQEEKFKGEGWGPHFEFCQWNASAAIILSFSAIEAAVDEIEGDLDLPRELKVVIERAKTLERAQALLAHLGKTPFDKGSEPYQGANLLKLLRNGLVHPWAEWDHARGRNYKLSRKIISAGLSLSPFQKDPELAFPYGCMSADVADWARSSAQNLIRELRQRLDLKPTV